MFIFPDSAYAASCAPAIRAYRRLGTPVPSTNWSRRSSSSLASPSPPDLESYSQTHSPLYTASDDSPHSSQPGDSFDAGYPSPAPSSHLNLFGPVSAHQEHALPPPVADAYPYPNMFATHQHHPIQEMYYNAEADTASRNPTIGYPSPYQSLPSISESSLPLYDDSSSMPSYPIQHSRDHSHLQVSSSLIPRSPADNSNIYVPRNYDSPPQQSYSDSASNPSPPTSFSSPQQHYVDSVRNPSPPLPFPRSQHPDSAPYTMAPAAYPQPQQWPAPPPPIPSHSSDYLPHLHNVNPCAGPQSPHNTPSTQYAYDVYPWPQ